jgi:hypothetical protein
MRILNSCVAAGVILLAFEANAQGQDRGERTIAQYSCKDVMRENGVNRDVAVAFLHGYLTGKAGTDRFNVEMLRRQTDAFIDRCLDEPGMNAVDAMSEVKK